MTSTFTNNAHPDPVMMIQVPPGALKVVPPPPSSPPGEPSLAYIQLTVDEIKAVLHAGNRFLVDVGIARHKEAVAERAMMTERAADEFVACLYLKCVNCGHRFPHKLKDGEYADTIGQNVIVQTIETRRNDGTPRQSFTVPCLNCGMTRLSIELRTPNLERLAAREWLAAHPEGGFVRNYGGVIGEIEIPRVRFDCMPLSVRDDVLRDLPSAAAGCERQTTTAATADRPHMISIAVEDGKGGVLATTGISIEVDALLGYAANTLRDLFGRTTLAKEIREVLEEEEDRRRRAHVVDERKDVPSSPTKDR
jgi:hypothetical protein